MHYTRRQFAVGRLRLFLVGIGRPLLIAAPSLLLVARWWLPGAPEMGLGLWLVWLASSLAVVWLVALNAAERIALVGGVRSQVARVRLAAVSAR
jgi:hypothetical protein